MTHFSGVHRAQAQQNLRVKVALHKYKVQQKGLTDHTLKTVLQCTVTAKRHDYILQWESETFKQSCMYMSRDENK